MQDEAVSTMQRHPHGVACQRTEMGDQISKGHDPMTVVRVIFFESLRAHQKYRNRVRPATKATGATLGAPSRGAFSSPGLPQDGSGGLAGIARAAKAGFSPRLRRHTDYAARRVLPPIRAKAEQGQKPPVPDPKTWSSP